MSGRKLSKRKNTSAVNIPILIVVVQLLSHANSFANSWTAARRPHCPRDCQARTPEWAAIPSPWDPPDPEIKVNSYGNEFRKQQEISCTAFHISFLPCLSHLKLFQDKENIFLLITWNQCSKNPSS